MSQPFLMKFPQYRKLKTNVVYCADNWEVMKQLPSDSINLIYVDPPFCTQTVRKSKAWDKEVQLGDFDDVWGGKYSSYILWMTNRLREMRRLLKPEGILCVHLDYRAVHYIKVELDKIFGEGSPDKGAKHLINEIVWLYKSGGANKKSFAKKHDSILVYGKSKNYTFNLEKEKTYRNESGAPIGKQKYYYDKGGKYTFVHPKDWWNIPMLSVGCKERIGYPTQKPIALLNKFIKAFTNKGDIVADFFCGCGTTLSSAQKLNRKWLGVDISKDASKVIRKRMTRDHQMEIEIVSLKSLTKDQIMGLKWAEFEKYVVRSIGGIPNEKQRGDGGIDGRLQEDGTPIQVKKSNSIGRNVIDNFHKHLKINGKGIIIAKSFNRGAKNEVARLKLEEGYDVSLITVDDILRDAS